MNKVRKILVPIDFSAESGWALRNAVSLAQETRAQLLALHVIDMSAEREILLSSLALADGWPFQPCGSGRLPADVLLRERTLDLWNFVAQEVGPANQDRIVKVIKMGPLAKKMPAFIREQQIDLLVVKLRKRFLFPDLPMFNLLKIARKLSCPVLLDPPAAPRESGPGRGLLSFDWVAAGKLIHDPVG